MGKQQYSFSHQTTGQVKAYKVMTPAQANFANFKLLAVASNCLWLLAA